MSTLEVRKLCFEYADKYVKVQSEQFQRLGILGDWANPYQTMSPDYEAKTLEVFARLRRERAGLQEAQAGSLVDRESDGPGRRGTGIQDVTDKSVFVEFPLMPTRGQTNGRVTTCWSGPPRPGHYRRIWRRR
jgi:isoleucyl-tRNA synthetase